MVVELLGGCSDWSAESGSKSHRRYRKGDNQEPGLLGPRWAMVRHLNVIFCKIEAVGGLSRRAT